MTLAVRILAVVRNVLFLCTGNSARSILAEALLNDLGRGKFIAYSAGSKPAGKINPFAIELLQQHGLHNDSMRSKSWDEFTAAGGPTIDFVFTVCDNAAAESCPIWAGRPQTAHWGIPDPASVAGTDAEKRLAFSNAYRLLASKIERFINLPFDSLSGKLLQQQLDEIGREHI
jgi:protein-tyrosine-phosphatase